jgi:ribosomal protein S12 methylthiotransferase accessory factor
MESEAVTELAPFPAEGFACDFTDDKALTRALLEASQARISAIAGAREDITRQAYPEKFDREWLHAWRVNLARPLRARPFPGASAPKPPDPRDQLDRLLGALVTGGATMAAVVPLFLDRWNDIIIVRVVAPPFEHGTV